MFLCEDDKMDIACLFDCFPLYLPTDLERRASRMSGCIGRYLDGYRGNEWMD